MRPLVALVFLLAAPASASAAPFGELPPIPLTTFADCTRATGAPGELIQRTNDGANIQQLGPTGLTRIAALTADPVDCPRAAARPNGTGIVAFKVLREERGKDAEMLIQAAVRDPGGAWGPVTDAVAAPEFANGNSLAVAVSDTGEGLIAVALKNGPLQIRVARRSPGGTFGAPQTVFAGRTGSSTEPSVQAGMSASGEAVVAWSFVARDGLQRELWAAVAAPGAAFGAPARVGEVQLGSPFSLAVGEGGHALLAFGTGTQLRVAERAPGGGFAPAAVVGPARERLAILPVAALDAGGGAIVVWQRASDSALDAVLRAGPGPFGKPITVSPAVRLPLPDGLQEFFDAFAPLDVEGEHSTAESGPDAQARYPSALLSGGRALVTFAVPTGRDGVWSLAPRSATLSLASGAVETRAQGAGVRDVHVITPLPAAGGVPAVLWSDESPDETDDRLHVALEGVAEAAEAGPRVQVAVTGKRALRGSEALVLRVTCSAACEVRAQTGAGLAGANGTLSLGRAGSGRLRLDPEYRPIVPPRGGLVRVRVRSSAPGARAATVETLTVRLRRRPGPPLPRVIGAVARRDGDDVVVTWRTTRDADAGNQFVFSPSPLGYAEATGASRRFRARMREVPGLRSVSIWVSDASVFNARRTRVRVRG